jgi:hypothetical protein
MHDLSNKIENRLKKQWESKYATLKRNRDYNSDFHTGILEAGRAIARFYQRSKHSNERANKLPTVLFVLQITYFHSLFLILFLKLNRNGLL